MSLKARGRSTIRVTWKMQSSAPFLRPFSPTILVLSIAFNLLVAFTNTLDVSASALFSLKYKYAGTNRSLHSLRTHDIYRLHMLYTVDLPLGGNGRPDSSGLYYAKIGIGTPANNYYLQVDTGSNLMWVNCIDCTDCPKRGYHGIELQLYDIKESRTGSKIPCDQDFCLEANGGPLTGCKSNFSCIYSESYEDGSSTTGYFVKDIVQYDPVSGNNESSVVNGSVIFGCSTGEFVNQDSSTGVLDGILGFGKSNTSVNSQLAASGLVRNMFAHCLDGINGGGIFAIGHVIEPKVNTTPMITNQPHYNINMTAVKVGRDLLKLPSDIFQSVSQSGTILDCGTTLAYLPEIIYQPLMYEIFSYQPNLRLRTVQDQYTCFEYSESLDDGFPPVTFVFENSLSLKVHPHEYLFPIDDLWCVGWQNSGMQSRDKMNLTLFGDLVLSNKLVVYDLENMEIGWTDYNCSSSIQVKDKAGTVHLVGAHSIPSAGSIVYSCMYSICLLLLALVWLISF